MERDHRRRPATAGIDATLAMGTSRPPTTTATPTLPPLPLLPTLTPTTAEITSTTKTSEIDRRRQSHALDHRTHAAGRQRRAGYQARNGGASFGKLVSYRTGSRPRLRTVPLTCFAAPPSTLTASRPWNGLTHASPSHAHLPLDTLGHSLTSHLTHARFPLAAADTVAVTDTSPRHAAQTPSLAGRGSHVATLTV